MLVQDLYDRKLIHPPKFIPNSTHYLVIMGSEAYGCSSNSSDKDFYGFAIPPKEDVFPHLRGEIPGFGNQINRFEQWQEHHVEDKDRGCEYDFSVYSIIKFFQLCMDNNPNMVDSLFVPQRCVVHCTQIGNLVRENRKIFLHKGCWHKFKGYAYSNLHKCDIKNPQPGSKRAKNIEEFGMDTKYLYHVVRLLLEVEQILVEQDLDLERNREILKAIRRGEWTVEAIKDFFSSKEKILEEVYHTSSLPYSSDENKIKQLLLDCLEEYYGSLKDALVIPNQITNLVNDLESLIEKYRGDI
jgi:predicted nucleotidyltransferase